MRGGRLQSNVQYPILRPIRFCPRAGFTLDAFGASDARVSHRVTTRDASLRYDASLVKACFTLVHCTLRHRTVNGHCIANDNGLTSTKETHDASRVNQASIPNTIVHSLSQNLESELLQTNPNGVQTKFCSEVKFTVAILRCRHSCGGRRFSGGGEGGGNQSIHS